MDSAARLTDISTCWTLLHRALDTPPADARALWEQVILRYRGAVRRYLQAAVPDPHDRDELEQELLLRLVRGDFRAADPGRGRFRDYLKSALYHLVVDYQRRRKRAPTRLDADVPDPAEPEPAAADAAFADGWRACLVERTWGALAEWESATGQPGHTVLRLRTDQPTLPSDQLAGRLGELVGRSFTAEATRKALQRAREKFADLLLEEVAGGLDGPTPDRVADELAAVGLLAACRDALRRRYGG